MVALLAWYSLISGGSVDRAGDVLKQLEIFADDMRQWRPIRSGPATAFASDAFAQIDALLGYLRSAVDLALHASPARVEAFARLESKKPWRLRLSGTFATVRANLSLKSAAFRHAVRLAVCVVIGYGLAQSLSLRRASRHRRQPSVLLSST